MKVLEDGTVKGTFKYVTHCVVSMIGLPTFEGMDSVVVMKVA